jgi:hypothetical protein
VAIPKDSGVMSALFRLAAAHGGERFTPEIMRRNPRRFGRKGRFWSALTLTIGLTALLAWTAAAEGAQGRSASSVVGSGQASASPSTVYLPAVFRGNPGCTTKPTLISPPNGSNLSTLSPLYMWDDGSNPAATASRLEIARDAAFTDVGASLRAGIHGQWEFRFSVNLSPSTTYYWRAFLECGSMRGPYSDVWSFTTGSGGIVLPAPALVAPADGATVPSRMVTLQWSPVPGTVDYLVRWHKVSETGYTYAWIQGTQMAEYLSASTTYEWWVSARSDYAIGPDSETWQFTTPAAASSAAGQATDARYALQDGDATIVVEERGTR